MKDLTNGNEALNILKFTIPMFIGNIFQQVYNITDTIIVGQFIGKSALASVGATFPIIFFLISLAIGLNSGIIVIIGQYFGAKNFIKLKETIYTSYIISTIISIFITILGFNYSREILLILKTPSDVIIEAITYIKVIFIGTIFLFLFNAIQAIFRGLGDSNTPLYFLIISSILNLILDILFVIFLKMGVFGVAFATTLSQGISLFLGIIYLFFTENKILKFKIQEISFSLDILVKSLKIGLPTAIQQMLVSFGIMALTKIVNNFGSEVLAGFTIAGRIDSMAMMPAMNFSMALSSFVAQNIGARKLERIKKGFYATTIMSLSVSLFFTFIIITFSDFLIRLFNTEPYVVKIGKEYLIIVSSCYSFFAFMFVINGVLRGAGDTIISMFITLFSLWIIRIPLSYMLSFFLGPKGIWFGIPIAWIIGASFAFFYYLTGKWKKVSFILKN